jgi:hypothetical protein
MILQPSLNYLGSRSSTKLYGYLDDLSKDLYSVADNPDIESSTKEATDLKKEFVDRMGPGDWSTYVEFNEFDGGDGQMGVAGDGKKVRVKWLLPFSGRQRIKILHSDSLPFSYTTFRDWKSLERTYHHKWPNRKR